MQRTTLTVAELRQAIDQLPRVHLAVLPTPLEEAARLSDALGGPPIFFKRDDLTGLALGGNKTRHLEFILGEALQQGADTIITGASIQSNFCRQTAAACAKLGLRCVLYLNGEEPDAPQGNLVARSFGRRRRARCPGAAASRSHRSLRRSGGRGTRSGP